MPWRSLRETGGLQKNRGLFHLSVPGSALCQCSPEASNLLHAIGGLVEGAFAMPSMIMDPGTRLAGQKNTLALAILAQNKTRELAYIHQNILELSIRAYWSIGALGWLDIIVRARAITTTYTITCTVTRRA